MKNKIWKIWNELNPKWKIFIRKLISDIINDFNDNEVTNSMSFEQLISEVIDTINQDIRDNEKDHSMAKYWFKENDEFQKNQIEWYLKSIKKSIMKDVNKMKAVNKFVNYFDKSQRDNLSEEWIDCIDDLVYLRNKNQVFTDRYKNLLSEIWWEFENISEEWNSLMKEVDELFWLVKE